MECNIDARGKGVRLVGGTASLLTGVAIAGLVGLGALEYASWWPPVAGLVAGGCLGIFEGRSGWCVVRAAGIWTPI